MKGLNEPTKGFLISCDKNREKEALRDAYNFLSEFIEEIYNDVTEQNIIKKIKQDGKELTLENEIKYQKQKQNKLLTQVETNVNCLIFIKINHLYPQIDPLVVVDKIMKDVHQSGREITRYCHRILPVERAFKAEHFKMLDTIDELVNIHSQGGQIKSWMLNFKCRNNNKFNYKEVLKEVTIIANKYSHFTDIYYPQWTISIQINNHLMCLSIAEKFKQTNQFKLHKNLPKQERRVQKYQDTQKKERNLEKVQQFAKNKKKQEQNQFSSKINKNDNKQEEQNQAGNQELELKSQLKQKNQAMLKQIFNIPQEDIDFL